MLTIEIRIDVLITFFDYFNNVVFYLLVNTLILIRFLFNLNSLFNFCFKQKLNC
jgi:hypothetical protein